MITLVTGNPDKLAEFRSIFPPEIELTTRKLKIPEIQGEEFTPREIVEAKLRSAYELIDGPVIVEDTSAELDCLNGLPGPFIKAFEAKLGADALWRLARFHDDHRATIRSVMGYKDNTRELIVEGVVRGKVVPPIKGNGFGFDCVFMPDGYDIRTSQMTPEQKNAISWRGLATTALARAIFRA